jgi:predicted HD phosphohydrolase
VKPAEAPRNVSPDDLPRIIIETKKEIEDMATAARRLPYLFTGLGPDVYLGLTPPFTVGTHVSQNAILGWQQVAAEDPVAAGYLADLGVPQQEAAHAA